MSRDQGGPSSLETLPNEGLTLPHERNEGSWPHIAPGEVQVGYWGTFLLRKSGQALEWAAQGSSGDPIPAGIEERCGHSAQGRGLAVTL